MSHTPGPWMVTAQDTRAVYVEAESDSFIAEVFASDQAEANARLIAAAPELLEALIEQTKSTAFYNGQGDGLGPDPNDPNEPVWLRYLCGKARGAIAKATGIEP